MRSHVHVEQFRRQASQSRRMRGSLHPGSTAPGAPVSSPTTSADITLSTWQMHPRADSSQRRPLTLHPMESRRGPASGWGEAGNEAPPAPAGALCSSSARHVAFLLRHIPAAVPGSSPPAVPPSDGASPQCCRASPRPAGKNTVSSVGAPTSVPACYARPR